MIEVDNLRKEFGKTTALSGITCQIPKGCVAGLVGSNGAGKSTLLRLISGVYKADSGTITLGGMPVYDNPEAKSRLVFVPDELYFLPHANLRRMAELFAAAYPSFNGMRLRDMQLTFGLDMGAPLDGFSKGMKRQAALALALSCNAPYLLLDETFDGLDPSMRNLAKKLVFEAVEQHRVTVLLTGHSLRELEDTCDCLALLHQGRLILQSEIGRLKTTLTKAQVAFGYEYDRSLFDGLDLVHFTKHGSVATLILRGEEGVMERLRQMNPLLLEPLPLTLDEVFLYEMQALGYAPQNRLTGGVP